MLTVTLSGPGGGGGHGGGMPGGGHGGGMPGGGHGGGMPGGGFPGGGHGGGFPGHLPGGGGYPGGYGYRRGGWAPMPYYNYAAPDVIVVQPPTRDCRFAILLPTGEQIVVTGSCPVALTQPVRATITPL